MHEAAPVTASRSRSRASGNPRGGSVPSKPHIYVGITVRRVEARYQAHKAGGQTASGLVRDHGKGLLPELYEKVPRVATEEEARKLEDWFAAQLEQAGYTVHCGRGFFWDRYRQAAV